MSGEIVNLRQARKRRARDDALRRAEANRLKFGRTKAQRRHEDAHKSLEDSRLDALIRERPETKDES